MSMVTYGDMARFQALRGDGAQLRSDLTRLTAELASGKVSDPGRALGGDFSTLSDITRSLRLNTAFRNSIADAAIAAAGRQNALNRVAAEIEGFAPSLLALAGLGDAGALQLELLNAPERFDQAIDVLNTRLAGRSLFAADAPDATPLIDSEAILVDLETLTATATDATTVIATVQTWFVDTNGGYETLAWRGGTGPAPEVLLSEGETAETGITALDPAIRETLSGLAMAALAARGNITLPKDEQRALVTASAQQVLSAEEALIALRAHLGEQEARIEEARVASEAAKSSLEIEYGRLLDVDPFRTATELENVNTRLESLYILTARLSRLSLTEFLR